MIDFVEEAFGLGFGVLGVLALILFLPVLIAFGASIALYVLQALGVYKIAQRRGIRNPWMAWVPLLHMWTLGSISDQYRYVVKGQYRYNRTVLTVLGAVNLVLSIVFNVLYAVSWASVLSKLPAVINGVFDANMLGAMLQNTMGNTLWVSAANALVALAALVIRYICLYDLFASCWPKYKVLLLVLGILFPVALPVFLFICRNQDQGMPPRRDRVVQEEPEAAV